MLVRPAVIGDLHAVAEIQASIRPYVVQSMESRRRAFLTGSDRARARLLVAEIDGRIVGYTSAMLDHTTSEPDAAMLSVDVHPGFRRHGVGTALLTAAEVHLRAAGAAIVRVWRTDEEDSAVFAERHGYRRRRSKRFFVIDPRRLQLSPPAPDGLRLVSLDEAGRDAIYTFDCVAPLDEPGDRPAGILPKAEWTTLYWEDPDQRRELGVAALRDDRVVAATYVVADLRNSRSWSAFTGVLADHRERGLARLVKTGSLIRAAAAGVTSAYTSNDASNAPMLAVNDRLGYRLTAIEHLAVRPA